MSKHRTRYGVPSTALAPGARVEWNWAGGVEAQVVAVLRASVLIRWQARDGRRAGQARVAPSSLRLIQAAPPPRASNAPPLGIVQPVAAPESEATA